MRRVPLARRSLVEVTLIEDAGDTILTARHTGIPNAFADLHASGSLVEIFSTIIDGGTIARSTVTSRPTTSDHSAVGDLHGTCPAGVR